MSDNRIEPAIHFASVAPSLFRPTELQAVLHEHSLAVAKGLWSDYRIDCEADFTCVTAIARDGTPYRTFTIWDGSGTCEKYYEIQDFGYNPIQTDDFNAAITLFTMATPLNMKKPAPGLHLRLIRNNC